MASREWQVLSTPLHTPNAAGPNKPQEFLERQGNPTLQKFEQDMGPSLQTRGIDHLSIFNATLNSTKSPDGTHAGWKNNILKAMFIFNWLHWIGLEIEAPNTIESVVGPSRMA